VWTTSRQKFKKPYLAKLELACLKNRQQQTIFLLSIFYFQKFKNKYLKPLDTEKSDLLFLQYPT
jgi:hypothetical protein